MSNPTSIYEAVRRNLAKVVGIELKKLAKAFNIIHQYKAKCKWSGSQKFSSSSI